ncbi:MAG: ROK family protein [Geodermatophilaceae bacterium]
MEHAGATAACQRVKGRVGSCSRYPHGYGDVVLQALLDLVEKIQVDHPEVAAVGVDAAGMVDWPSGSLRWAPNDAYSDLPLEQQLSERTGLPAVVENDANAAAWSEAGTGSGRWTRPVGRRSRPGSI